jgi:hypothetical protein
MGLDPLFPGMVNTAGALLPALISIGFVLTRRAGSKLGSLEQASLVALSLILSFALARVSITPHEISLHIVPGATLCLCYLAWRGHVISPGLAFALTYASSLPVDVLVAQVALGAQFNTEGIGGGGWGDGLLVFPTLTALAIVYANWRIATVGRAGLIWSGQRSGGVRVPARIHDVPASPRPARSRGV